MKRVKTTQTMNCTHVRTNEVYTHVQEKIFSHARTKKYFLSSESWKTASVKCKPTDEAAQKCCDVVYIMNKQRTTLHTQFFSHPLQTQKQKSTKIVAEWKIKKKIKKFNLKKSHVRSLFNQIMSINNHEWSTRTILRTFRLHVRVHVHVVQNEQNKWIRFFK